MDSTNKSEIDRRYVIDRPPNTGGNKAPAPNHINYKKSKKIRESSRILPLLKNTNK